MQEISVKELRNYTRDVIRRVESGDALTLTVHGRPVADIVPHNQRRESIPMRDLAKLFPAAGSGPERARDLDDLTTDDPIKGVD